MAARKNRFDLRCLVELLLEKSNSISLQVFQVASTLLLKKMIDLILKVIPLLQGLFAPELLRVHSPKEYQRWSLMEFPMKELVICLDLVELKCLVFKQPLWLKFELEMAINFDLNGH